MNETVVHRDRLSQTSIGLRSGGSRVVLRLLDGDQRAQVVLAPEQADALAREIVAHAAQARAAGIGR